MYRARQLKPLDTPLKEALADFYLAHSDLPNITKKKKIIKYNYNEAKNCHDEAESVDQTSHVKH